MRNFYDVLGLDRLAEKNSVKNTLDTLTPEQLDEEGDLLEILDNTQWRSHYKRLHLQYDAIAATLANPAFTDTNNHHQWDKRAVEFEPEQNTIELPS